MIGIKVGKKFKVTIKDGDKIYCFHNSSRTGRNVSEDGFAHANLDGGELAGGTLEESVKYTIKERIKNLDKLHTREIIIFIVCYFLDKRTVANRMKVILYEK